jgi:class 3 adenylate cyclase
MSALWAICRFSHTRLARTATGYGNITTATGSSTTTYTGGNPIGGGDETIPSEGPREDHLERKLAAILAADIAGYSALMGANEEATVRDLKAHQAVILPMIGKHGGHIIDTAADGILAEFPSVVNAVECAVAVQNVMAERMPGIRRTADALSDRRQSRRRHSRRATRLR